MKLLVISQVFWPDACSGSQHLTDLAEDMVTKGHSVHVFSSLRDYEAPEIRYKPSEIYKGVHIYRIPQTAFGKKTTFGRMVNFLAFNIFSFLKLLRVKQDEYDVILGMTVPPFLSFLGVVVAKIKKIKFAYWAMDLQPELAITAGYVKKGSLSSKVLQRMANYILQNADLVIALDRYMTNYIVKKGASPAKVIVIPVWPVMYEIYIGERLANPWRNEHNFGDKLVVMYSGNHAAVHPLDTLLEAALLLLDDSRFLFVFVGGGVRKKDVSSFRDAHKLTNVIQLPYQPRNIIHLTLGAADIHVVVHGNGCTGYTHSNKIYGAMNIGRPILHIGPRPNHISDILDTCPGNINVEHGHSRKLARELVLFAAKSQEQKDAIGLQNREYADEHFARDILTNQMIQAIERLANTH